MMSPSIYDYTGLKEDEYNILRNLSQEKGLCSLCHRPRKSDGDDFCELHRMVYSEWSYLYEISIRRVQDFELMNKTQKLAEDLNIPIWNISNLFDGIKEMKP